jgi:hypothetical protein
MLRRSHAYVLMGNHVHLLVSSPLLGAASETLRPTTQIGLRLYDHPAEGE